MPLAIWIAASANWPDRVSSTPILMVCCALAASGTTSAAAVAVRRTVRSMDPPPKEAVPYQNPQTVMKRSAERILTTHVGSLPYMDGNSVETVVRKQREVGLDLVNEGEYTKGGDWLSYMEARFGGFEARAPKDEQRPLITQ